VLGSEWESWKGDEPMCSRAHAWKDYPPRSRCKKREERERAPPPLAIDSLPAMLPCLSSVNSTYGDHVLELMLYCTRTLPWSCPLTHRIRKEGCPPPHRLRLSLWLWLTLHDLRFYFCSSSLCKLCPPTGANCALRKA